MSIYFTDDTVTLHHGDALAVLARMPDESVDAVVTDPPYALGFMGKSWDTFGKDVGRGAQARVQRAAEVTPTGQGHATSAGPYLASGVDSLRAAGLPFQQWCESWARECLRVLKPGGHMLAFGGTRTWHRLAAGIEDAGFEIRDSLAWLYGSGFPKSLDVSKAIDKAAGAEREVVGPGQYASRGRRTDNRVYGEATPSEAEVVTLPATPDAEHWQGWGTALKPAFEPIVVARKPLAGGTVAANVLEHGTGALNIDGCRVGEGGQLKWAKPRDMGYHGGTDSGPVEATTNPAGRWPTNVVLDDSQADELDEQSGDKPPSSRTAKGGACEKPGHLEGHLRGVGSQIGDTWGYDDTGGASRFFPTFRYEAKASRSERPRVNGTAHPTVKPLDLMRWLVRLVTPTSGTVLEPFTGSGTTVEACIIEGFRCVAIEREADYLPLIEQRIYRRRDPVAAIRLAGDDLGLFDTDARRLSQGVLDFSEEPA